MFILSGGGGDILNNMYRTSSCLILSALDGEKHNVIPKMCRWANSHKHLVCWTILETGILDRAQIQTRQEVKNTSYHIAKRSISSKGSFLAMTDTSPHSNVVCRKRIRNANEFTIKQSQMTMNMTMNMGVSKNRGTPKSSILIGFSIINNPFWGYHYFWKHPYFNLHANSDASPLPLTSHKVPGGL